jgi:hypothetical protein
LMDWLVRIRRLILRSPARIEWAFIERPCWTNMLKCFVCVNYESIVGF